MKRFILKILIFCTLLVISDFALGGIYKLYNYTKGGEIHKVHAIMKTETPDMVIMGSSRASHHFDPQIFVDSIGLSVYNAGIDGMGATVAYGFLNGLKLRKTPKIILFELTPDFDILNGFPVSLDIFNPYIENTEIKKSIIDFDHSEQLKLKSNAYRLNSVIFRLIPSIIFNREVHEDGYIPLSGTLSNFTEKIKREDSTIIQIDSLKLEYLKKFLTEALKDGTQVFASVSPTYGNVNTRTYDEEIRIVETFNIPILYHLRDTAFTDHARLFQDKAHLNQDGARLYSKIIANQINSFIKNNR